MSDAHCTRCGMPKLDTGLCPMQCEDYLASKKGSLASRGVRASALHGASSPHSDNPTESESSIMNDKATPSAGKGAPPKATTSKAPPNGGKGAPAAPPAQAGKGTPAAAPATAAKPANGATTEATGNGGSTAEGGKKRLSKLPLPVRFAVKMRRTSARVERIVGIAGKWDKAELVTLGEAVTKALDEYAGALEKLPADFKPPKGTRSSVSTPLAVGTKVDLNDQAIKRYAEVVEPVDRVGLEVLKVAGNKLVCKTKSGDRIMLVRGQVRIAGSEDTGTDETEDTDSDSDDEDEE